MKSGPLSAPPRRSDAGFGRLWIWLPVVLIAGSLVASVAGGQTPAPPPAAAPQDGGAKTSDGPGQDEGGPSEEPSPTVTIAIRTIPAARASLRWGGKRLGIVRWRRPLVIKRPRDSGPMDVVVRARGYLPVRTRIHTFESSDFYVKLVPKGQENTLFGYRQEPDAGYLTDVDGDAGVKDGGEAGDAGASSTSSRRDAGAVPAPLVAPVPLLPSPQPEDSADQSPSQQP